MVCAFPWGRGTEEILMASKVKTTAVLKEKEEVKPEGEPNA